MALIDMPIELFYALVGGGPILAGLVAVIAYRLKNGNSGGGGGGTLSSLPGVLGKPHSDKIQTFVTCFEPSGLEVIVVPKSEDVTHITFEYSGNEYRVKHSYPFTPVGRPERKFMWPIGSDSMLDPRELHNQKDLDDPEPVIQETASWMRSIRAAMGNLGFSLKQNWFVIVMIIGFAGAIGYVLGNAYPLK